MAEETPHARLIARLEALRDRIAALGISWNDAAGTELDGEPLRLWDEDGEPEHGHPWIQGQCLARKQAAAEVQALIDDLSAAALLHQPAERPQQTDAHFNDWASHIVDTMARKSNDQLEWEIVEGLQKAYRLGLDAALASPPVEPRQRTDQENHEDVHTRSDHKEST